MLKWINRYWERVLDMEFVKMHGLGNDFIIALAGQPDLPETLYAQTAVKLCDRNFGIGADGLVIIGPDAEFDLFMRIFNSDGSEAEMCGNVIRCVAKHAWETGMTKKTELGIRTLGGPRYTSLIMKDGQVSGVRVDMGQPILEAEKIPVDWPASPVTDGQVKVDGRQFDFTAVSMGNPHCIIQVEDAVGFPLRQWGSLIETAPLFPAKTNVEFVTVVDRKNVIMRVWERGAGVTLACGTGACAVGVACALLQLTDRNVTVHLQGGDLLIEWSAADNHVYMTGPATRVFTGQIDLN
ncbi:MAG: diaminopimelate epimerase [Methylocystaceae bacterium]